MTQGGYSEYASAPGWLNAIPSSWRHAPLWAVATCNDEVLTESSDPDQLIQYVEISGVAAGKGITEVTEVAFGQAPSRARRKVQHGDVLVSTVRTYLRAIAPIISPPSNMIASTGFAVLRARDINPDFLGYVAQAEYFISEVIARSVGVSYPAINASDLMKIVVPVASPSEQTAIAAFLDRETGKIDALVEEQKRLIELLKEKRQAVISHAVTKGLDPNARMKPSGVEWLGDVPEHWKVARLQRVCSFEPGKAHEPFFDDDGQYICVTARFISTGGIPHRYCTECITPARRDDILMVMSDLPNGRALARAFIVNDEGPYAVNQRVCALTPREGSPLYFFYQLDRNPGLLRHDDGSNQTHLSNADFLKLPILVPPAEEQDRIAEWLRAQTELFTKLSFSAEQAIVLLQERRSALIAAAVTGKIDVRSITAQEEAA